MYRTFAKNVMAIVLVNSFAYGAQMRKPSYPILPVMVERWSPRAMGGELTDDHIKTLIEAARWAPSSYNNQPWRFIVAKKGTSEFDHMLSLLVPFNQLWAKNAAALIAIVSHNTFYFNGQPSRSHTFDTGAAWQNIALQATSMGLVTHGMEGLEYDKAHKELALPADVTLEMIFAVGKPAPVDVLPERMQKDEQKTDRKPITELMYKGSWGIQY